MWAHFSARLGSADRIGEVIPGFDEVRSPTIWPVSGTLHWMVTLCYVVKIVRYGLLSAQRRRSSHTGYVLTRLLARYFSECASSSLMDSFYTIDGFHEAVDAIVTLS
jgi:hypothetical protein